MTISLLSRGSVYVACGSFRGLLPIPPKARSDDTVNSCVSNVDGEIVEGDNKVRDMPDGE